MIPEGFWKRMKRIQRIHLYLYESGRGWILGKLILILFHAGRKSGKRYATPLQYELIDGSYYVGAARGLQADWFRNVAHNPTVDVAVGLASFTAYAECVTDPERVAAFLTYRIEKHPLMIGLMMKLHKLPMKPSREQLLALGNTTALVILHPKTDVH